MKPPSAYPWDNTLSGSGKQPSLLREHYTHRTRKSRDRRQAILHQLEHPRSARPFPGSNDADEELPADTKDAIKATGRGKGWQTCEAN